MDFQNILPYKALAHVHRWKHLANEGARVPQPAFVALDPVSFCNFNCAWCNAKKVRECPTRIDPDLLLKLPKQLKEWQGIPEFMPGVNAVCIAGSGEPLLHPAIDDLLFGFAEYGIKVGLVTNGWNVDDHLEALSTCSFVGVSVDAGSAQTFFALKKHRFETIINNIESLINYSSKKNTALHQLGGVGYKMLMMPENVRELLAGARIAQSLGCRIFQARPVDKAWFESGTIEWTDEEIEIIQAQRPEIESLCGIETRIVMNKFDANLHRKRIPYDRCLACLAIMVIRPSATNGFRFEFCEDHRGNDATTLIYDSHDFEEIKSAWGSPRHWEMFRAVNLDGCPRCKNFQNIEIIEELAVKDSLLIDLI